MQRRDIIIIDIISIIDPKKRVVNSLIVISC